MASKITVKSLEKMTFKSLGEMTNFTKELTAEDHAKICDLYGIGGDNADHTKSLANYIVQGLYLKKSGNELTEYAITQAELRKKSATTLAAAAASKPSVVKGEKIAKIKKEKKASTPRVKYGDFEIIYREDRGGYVGWYAGKGEAFRATVEKVNEFFMKKYKATGTLVPTVK
jgi:hypothetical protein